MNLVKNDQLVHVVDKIQFWLRKLGSVALGFKVKVNTGDGSGCFQRECNFADLTRPQDGNGGLMLNFVCHGVSFHDLQ